jgi:hypothetical protein
MIIHGAIPDSSIDSVEAPWRSVVPFWQHRRTTAEAGECYPRTHAENLVVGTPRSIDARPRIPSMTGDHRPESAITNIESTTRFTPRV